MRIYLTGTRVFLHFLVLTQQLLVVIGQLRQLGLHSVNLAVSMTDQLGQACDVMLGGNLLPRIVPRRFTSS
jgi:hypothetical protein